jgi:GNAT superfamily N-acetyltransferase
MSTEALSFTISQITSEEDFPFLATVEESAFRGPQTTLFFGSSASHDPSIAAARHIEVFRTDPTALYFKATLPSGQVIGLAKWNIFSASGPHFPWPTSGFAADANVELLAWFFGELDKKRNAFMVPRGEGYLYMALLAVDPKWQRMGVGRRLLEWGLEKADKEGLECWIEASPAGKPLYEKVGWKEVGATDVDLRKWGWKGKDGVKRTVSMFREVGGGNGD